MEREINTQGVIAQREQQQKEINSKKGAMAKREQQQKGSDSEKQVIEKNEQRSKREKECGNYCNLLGICGL